MIKHYSKETKLLTQTSDKNLHYSKPRYKLNISKKSLSYKKFMENCTQNSNMQSTFTDFLFHSYQYSQILNKKNLSSRKFKQSEINYNKLQYSSSKAQCFCQNQFRQIKKQEKKEKKTYRLMNKQTLYRNTNKQMMNVSNDELNYYRKTTRPNQNINNLILQEVNSYNFCQIQILKLEQRIKQKYKISTAQKFLKFLLNLIQGSIGFKSSPSNLLLDIFITLESQQCDLSFLNGQKITFQPIYKQLFPLISANSFQILKCIGSGGFSKVFLCRFKQNGKFYAMKMIEKSFIGKYNKWKIVMNQRNIMKQLKHPFIINMKFAFQSEDNIIFILQYCPGGQLFQLLRKYKRMSEAMAKFYMVQILLALQYMHKQGILYRDFKPQNILLDIQGHVKIADFGLAKPKYYSIQDRSFSFCGSPQYMSPQMILKEGHSLPVDFYCLGAVLYELVTGLPPFYSKNTDQIYRSTVNQQINFPQKLKLSNEIKSLLRELLQKDETIRIGSINGVKQVLEHPWFEHIQKQNYLLKLIKPPVNFVCMEQISIQFQQYSNSIFLQQAKKQQKQCKFKTVLNNFDYDFRNQHQKKQLKIQNNQKVQRHQNLQRPSQKSKKLINYNQFKKKLTEKSFNFKASQIQKKRKTYEGKSSQICNSNQIQLNLKLNKASKKKTILSIEYQ